MPCCGLNLGRRGAHAALFVDSPLGRRTRAARTTQDVTEDRRVRFVVTLGLYTQALGEDPIHSTIVRCSNHVHPRPTDDLLSGGLFQMRYLVAPH
jgi:hypothetical protein